MMQYNTLQIIVPTNMQRKWTDRSETVFRNKVLTQFTTKITNKFIEIQVLAHVGAYL